MQHFLSFLPFLGSGLPIFSPAVLLFFVFFISPPNAPVHAGALSDTGQTTCWDAAGNVIACPAAGDPMAQDGSYQGAQPHFHDNGDGTVTDLNTDLMWQQADNGIGYYWAGAEAFCSGLTLAGYDDWRMPEVKELLFLVNAGTSSPSCFSAFSCRSERYWASTSTWGGTMAYGVHFRYGGAGARTKTSLTSYVRCVRGGP